MTIEISRTAIKVRLVNMGVTVLFAALIFMVMLFPFFNKPFLGMNRGPIILIIALVYFIYVGYTLLLDRYYIFLNDDGQKIIFRYYSLRPLNQVKHSVEVPKSSFQGFEITNTRFGLVPKIVLFQKKKAGVFRYPPVSLSALSKDELAKLKKLLHKYAG